MREFWRELSYKRVKGRIQSFVVKGKEPLEKVARAVQTELKNRHISPEDLKRIIYEVEEESIKSFKNSKFTNLEEREQRFRLLLKRINFGL